MIELIEANWLLILLAVLVGFVVAWFLLSGSRKTKITREDSSAAPTGAKRNQALIAAPPASAKDPAPPATPAPAPEPAAKAEPVAKPATRAEPPTATPPAPPKDKPAAPADSDPGTASRRHGTRSCRLPVAGVRAAQCSRHPRCATRR